MLLHRRFPLERETPGRHKAAGVHIFRLSSKSFLLTILGCCECPRSSSPNSPRRKGEQTAYKEQIETSGKGLLKFAAVWLNQNTEKKHEA